MSTSALASLARVRLTPVVAGAVSGETIDAGSLWSTAPTVVFAIRRPGCSLCREDAKELSSRLKSGQYPNIKLVGVVKEVAPVKGAETDEVLGVNEFQTKYFDNLPVYLDHEKEFYAFFGNKSLLSQSLHSWNPFTLYNDYKSLESRLKSKGVDGNLKGEGLLKGGLLIISPEEGIVYAHHEQTGSEMPYEEIGNAIKKLVESRSVDTSKECAAEPAVTTEGESK